MVKIMDCVDKKFGAVSVLENLSLEIIKSEILCIVGPSGCGKSTILNVISGLIQPDNGSVYTEGEKIGYIFQEDRLLPWETVYNNIAIVSDEVEDQRIIEIIKKVDLNGFENAYPSQLSGGMKQRCSIARGFYYNASLLLMDEPFKSLDYDLKIKMLAYLVDLWKTGSNTIIYVTHDIDEAILLGHKVMVLSKRPTQIIKTFPIEIEHSARQLQDPALIQLRLEIIESLINS